MAMVSCRKAFTAKLLQNAKKNADIFAVATDSRGSVTLGEFGKQLPDRLIEFGIAERILGQVDQFPELFTGVYPVL